MDAETFYAQRTSEMEDADDQLRFDVDDALQALANGEADWSRELVTTAAAIWMDVFREEAPEKRHGLGLARFRKALTEHLELTAIPDGEPTSGQVNRVTYWVSTYTVNNATHAALVANGVKFQRWVTRRDAEVRDIHKPLDMQIRPVGSTFNVAGHNLHYPGEPVGPPEVWISCRCVIQPAVKRGDTMSTTSYEIGPEDDIEIDNPDIITSDDIFMVQRDWEGGTDYYGPFSREDAEQFSAGDGEHGVIPLLSGFAISDPTDIAVEPPDEDELVDEFDDDEEQITEVPVHGVIAPEGKPTGDGRQFAVGALSTRELPIPLRVEIMSTHGGMTSDVVTIGRVDAAWRDDATSSWRWTGAVVLDKPHAQETIAGIIDGTVRGVSLDGDDAIEDTTERDKMVAELGNEEPSAEQVAAIMALPTVYSQMRVAGLTIVPIPAFQEAYIGLGDQFAEDLSAEDLAALQACGCLEAGAPGIAGYEQLDKELEDLRDEMREAEDPAPAVNYVTSGDNATYLLNATGGTTVTASAATFAPGTHDGPGWITHPIPTSRIRRYWVSGKGAAKIRWGSPGDFNRCRRQLAKYVQNPDWLAGLCANMHYEALGFWPASHRGRRAAAAESLTASAAITDAGPIRYPAAWFSNPGLDHAAPLHIEGQRIYGYLAAWGVCHIGVQGMCRDVPRSRSGYGYFLKGLVDTDMGDQRVGTLTYGIGHASAQLRAAAATAHYDRTDAVRAFVNIGEDSHGIWFAGVLAPWVTEDDVFALKAIGALSGDWRNWSGLPEDYELVGAVAVNVPGYQLAASGAIGLGFIPSEESIAPVLASATVQAAVDPEMVGAIVRTAVAEYKHQEKVEAAVAPHRTKVRATRLAAARARLEEVK